MNLSDAIQIVQVSPNTLELYFPPRLVGGFFFLLLAAVAAALAIKFHDPTYRYASTGSFILFCGMSFLALFAGLDLCTYHAKVALSAQTQTFSYEERTIYYKTAKSFPLSDLQEAVVKAGTTQNRLLTLLVRAQPQISLGDGYNSRGNNFEAAHAINSFIARTAHR